MNATLKSLNPLPSLSTKAKVGIATAAYSALILGTAFSPVFNPPARHPHQSAPLTAKAVSTEFHKMSPMDSSALMSIQRTPARADSVKAQTPAPLRSK